MGEIDRERKSGSSICWVGDTEKIFKFNKIKNERRTELKSFGTATKRECNFEDHSYFSIYCYGILNEWLLEIMIFL